MLRIALVQMNPHVGNIEGNLEQIKDFTAQAVAAEAGLVVFPELAICGYPPLDLLLFDDFLSNCEQAIQLLLPLSEKIDIIVGGPSRNSRLEGKNLFNSAWHLSGGKVKAKVNKTLLPTYDVFDEYRYFEPNVVFQVVECKGVKIALTICEDLWNLDSDPMYVKNPMGELMKLKPDLMVNIASSPFSDIQMGNRVGVLRKNVEQYNLPLIYVNQVGGQTDLIFDGHSIALNKDGSPALKLVGFDSKLACLDFDGEVFIGESLPFTREAGEVYTHQALLLGIRDFFQKQNFKTAILGLSGGVDSALVATLAAKALGKDNVLAVMMPSEYSSEHSISDSIKLAENLGIKCIKVPITEGFDTLLETLEPHFEGKPAGLAEENLQARLRGNILMALSNKHGHIVLNTSNKSELAVGYGTLYGDMCGGLSVIGDLYKTQVYGLCRYINSTQEIIPQNILDKAPSAELRPDQKDSDSLPKYDILDAILHQYIELNQTAEAIIQQGFQRETVLKSIQLVNTSEYKRKQFAPILRVSQRAFGGGRRIPIVAKF